MRKFGLFLAALLAAQIAHADLDPVDYAFLLTAQTSVNPASITIRWPRKNVPSILVRRKLLGESNWGGGVTLAGSATSYTDTGVEAGKAYEYELQAVVQADPQQIAYGYICAGINLPWVETRGKIILVVDDLFAGPLAGELERLRKDLVGDGWTVVRRDVSRSSSPPQVKNVIRNEYQADPANVKAVFLFGHVPVPYSGLINPDMHASHLGAWPADVYYGEMDGEWTDYAVNKNNAEYSWNNNVPGDGKFDQSIIPGNVELEVGRVDFWDMPGFAPRSEQELLRNYLNKNHAFRHRNLNAAARGLIRDNFGTISADAPAVDAWRLFPGLFGANNYLEVGPNQFFPTLQNQSYLFAYAGGGGDWEKADGVGTTADFVNGNPQAIFYLLHGSWFGDWDNTDNFLRAAIATPSYGLVSIWSSLPHWYMHPMAMGETVGYATKLTQNNRGVYRNSVDLSLGEVHISMMGDPTLRAFPVAPPENLQLAAAADKVTLSWSPSSQEVNDYGVWYANSYDGPFERATRGSISGTSFTMPMPPAGHYVFMVRASTLQTTGSGSFYNLSQGIFLEADLKVDPPPPPPKPVITLVTTDSVGDESGDPIVFTLTRSAALEAALNVTVIFEGTAVAGEDFQASTNVSFQPGSATANVTITPIDDGLVELTEDVLISLVAGAAYDLGAPMSAKGTIKASGEVAISQVSQSPTGGFGFIAKGLPNRPYNIEARTPTSGWVGWKGGTCGQDGLIEYRESSATAIPCLYYRVVCY
jgi:hypothetical protein